MKPILRLLLLPPLLVQRCSAADKCVYPDGTDSNYDYPCDPNADVSICCGGRQGTRCLTNKLCEDGTGLRSRGSCTKGNDSKCADYCLATKNEGITLISCTNFTQKKNSYCCDLDPGCCESNRVFDLFPENPKIYAVWDESQLKFVSVGASSTATTTSLSPTNTNPVGSSDLSAGAQAGIGVGVTVLVLLFAAIAYLFWKMHKKSAAESIPPQVSLTTSPSNKHTHSSTIYSSDNSHNSPQAYTVGLTQPEAHPWLEMDGFKQPSELDAGLESERTQVELPANN